MGPAVKCFWIMYHLMTRQSVWSSNGEYRVVHYLNLHRTHITGWLFVTSQVHIGSDAMGPIPRSRLDSHGPDSLVRRIASGLFQVLGSGSRRSRQLSLLQLSIIDEKKKGGLLRWPNQPCKHDRIKKTENLRNLTEWEACKHDIFEQRIKGYVYSSDFQSKSIFNVYSPQNFSVITHV